MSRTAAVAFRESEACANVVRSSRRSTLLFESSSGTMTRTARPGATSASSPAISGRARGGPLCIAFSRIGALFLPHCRM